MDCKCWMHRPSIATAPNYPVDGKEHFITKNEYTKASPVLYCGLTYFIPDYPQNGASRQVVRRIVSVREHDLEARVCLRCQNQWVEGNESVMEMF